MSDTYINCHLIQIIPFIYCLAYVIDQHSHTSTSLYRCNNYSCRERIKSLEEENETLRRQIDGQAGTVYLYFSHNYMLSDSQTICYTTSELVISF